MKKIVVSLTDLSAFLELLKLYGADKTDPVAIDVAWSLSDMLINSESDDYIREDLEEWSENQIEFINNE